MKNQKILDLLSKIVLEKKCLVENDLFKVIALLKFLKEKNVDYNLDGLESIFNESICHDISLIKKVFDNCGKYSAENLFSKDTLEDLLN